MPSDIETRQRVSTFLLNDFLSESRANNWVYSFADVALATEVFPTRIGQPGVLKGVAVDLREGGLEVQKFDEVQKAYFRVWRI